jgi:hypothetical protein
MRSSDDLTKLVNQSGFPLQLAVERMVHDQTDTIGWRVLYREHGWKGIDGQSGFIDLVLENSYGSSVLVLEFKRVLDSDWLFLSDHSADVSSQRTRLWATNTADHGKEHCGYFDVRSLPESPESMYCVVAGQDSKTRPMLERVAAEVAAATQALAIEELPLITQRRHGLRMYISVIVTTARILLSRFDPTKVTLQLGEASEVTHEEKPWIRFRKQFSSDRAVEVINTDWDFSSVGNCKGKSCVCGQRRVTREVLAEMAGDRQLPATAYVT